ncbi:MAG TPA: Nif11-like leader peptide family natural product precursor [Aggregatilineales bacterium]|nr:Nif11-like leader peptide family natural product precursor [Aggregatilineales bacterium]
MSKESAATFIQKVNNSPALQDEVALVTGNIYGLLMIAAKIGFSFTRTDWEAAASAEVEQEGKNSWVVAFLDESNPVRSGA